MLTAQNGEEALRIFQEDPVAIALVLLDLGMPGMGGQRCLQEILALAPRAKVVVASGYTSDGQDQQALAAGAQAFVAKPFRKAELLGVIREVLDRRPSA
ncbi:MAG: response regulator [Desulfarculus sp.]|nr:response regulator [Desulfarculus sp.]